MPCKSNEGLRTVYEDRTVSLGELDTVMRAVLRVDRVFGHALIERKRETDEYTLGKLAEYTALYDKTWKVYLSTVPHTAENAKQANQLAHAASAAVAASLEGQTQHLAQAVSVFNISAQAATNSS